MKTYKRIEAVLGMLMEPGAVFVCPYGGRMKFEYDYFLVHDETDLDEGPDGSWGTSDVSFPEGEWTKEVA